MDLSRAAAVRCAAMRLAASLIAAALLAGCGGSAEPSPEQQIRSAYSTFTQAFRDGDGAAICRVSTQEIHTSFITAAAMLGQPSASCATAFESIRDDIPPGEFELTDLVVSGDTAKGRNPKAVDADDRVVEFSRVGGEWLVGG